MLSYHLFIFFLLLQTFLNQGYTSEPLPDTNATISLPSALADYLKPGERNKTRIQFNFFGTQKLFQVQISLAQGVEKNFTIPHGGNLFGPVVRT